MTISRRRTSEPPDSSREEIRKFLVKAGEIHGRQVTSALVSIWCEELPNLPPQILRPLLTKVLHTTTFFPVLADVLRHIEKVDLAADSVAAEQEWQKVMRQFCWSDLNPRQLSERTFRAALAAGGFDHLASCTTDDLQWAKKRFIEAYANLRTVEENTLYLDQATSQKLLNSVRDKSKIKQLPIRTQSATTPDRDLLEPPPVLQPDRVPMTEAESELRLSSLRQQAELVKQKYSAAPAAQEA